MFQKIETNHFIGTLKREEVFWINWDSFEKVFNAFRVSFRLFRRRRRRRRWSAWLWGRRFFIFSLFRFLLFFRFLRVCVCRFHLPDVDLLHRFKTFYDKLHFVTEYQKNLNLWSTMDPLSDTVNLVEHLVVLINQITGSQFIRIFWRIKNI